MDDNGFFFTARRNALKTLLCENLTGLIIMHIILGFHNRRNIKKKKKTF